MSYSFHINKAGGVEELRPVARPKFEASISVSKGRTLGSRIVEEKVDNLGFDMRWSFW